jgi:hypothetical protein
MKWLVYILIVGCGENGAVVKFDVQPRDVCVDKPVDVTWEVKGKAKLHAEPVPEQGWIEGDVDSTGTLHPIVKEDTKFTVTAVNANAAKGSAYSSQPVTVATPGDRRVTTSCAGGTCSGHFDVHAGSTVHVSGLANPRITQGGHTQPIRLCVVHMGMDRTCLDPRQHVDVNVVAAGDWIVDAQVSSDTPPPAFTVEVVLACPR